MTFRVLPWWYVWADLCVPVLRLCQFRSLFEWSCLCNCLRLRNCTFFFFVTDAKIFISNRLKCDRTEIGWVRCIPFFMNQNCCALFPAFGNSFLFLTFDSDCVEQSAYEWTILQDYDWELADRTGGCVVFRFIHNRGDFFVTWRFVCGIVRGPDLGIQCWMTNVRGGIIQRRHLGGGGGAGGVVAPPPPPRKKKKRKKRKKKRKNRKKEKKKRKRKKGTMNDVKLLHIKCCFFQFFNSPVALKNKKNFGPPKKKLKWRPWDYR